MDILKIHSYCLSFLLDHQSRTQNFYFVPRKINNKNRLNDGMFLRGNDNYLVLSFWDSSDSKEFIYNISFLVDSSGHSSIVLSCRDGGKKRKHIEAIKNLLEGSGKNFEQTKSYKWVYSYREDIHYLDTLQDFILREKPIIDEYIFNHQNCGIILADKELDDKYIKTLPQFKDYCKEISKRKKTDPTIVKASEYIMRHEHNRLSNELEIYLKKNGYEKVETEKDFVDIKAVNKEGKIIFFELKTALNVRLAIRQALGQLLEYNHYSNKNDADKLVIVTGLKPEEKDIEYLNNLRKRYVIPVYYQQFDYNKKELSGEY